MKTSAHKKKKKQTSSYKSVFLIICTIFTSIYPFISRLLLKKVPTAEASIFATTKGYTVDISKFSKEVALLGFAAFIILFFLGEHIFPDNIDKINRERLKSLRFPLICVAGYALLTVVSFLFSDYKQTALWGSCEEYEGMAAILCYCVLFVYAIYYFKTETALKILNIGILSMCLLVGVLSLIEIFWKPILEFTFLQDLISSTKNRELAHSIRCENFIGQIALMFHNPAYLGGFCSLFTPIVLGISLNEKTADIKNVKKSFTFYLLKAAYTVIPALLVLALFWSRSAVSIMCLVLSTAIIIIFYVLAHLKDKNKKQFLMKLLEKVAVPAVLFVVLYILSKVLPNSITYKHDQGLDTTIEEYSVAENSSVSSSSNKYPLSKATLDNGVLCLESNDTSLYVSMDMTEFRRCKKQAPNIAFENCLVFSDGTDQIKDFVPTTMKATTIQKALPAYKINDSRYDAVTFVCQQELLIFDFGYNGTVEFYLTDEGIKIFGQGETLLSEIPQPKVTGFESIYKFATGRGYTWSQSLPVLAHCLLLGNGNGTFSFYFVQNEIVGLLNTHGSCKYVVDRPHNWYIQVAVSSGLPALLLMLAAFIFYIIRFLKSFFVKKSISSSYLIGLFAGLLSFMAFGMINDSFITLFPLFWICFGVGVGNLTASSQQ